MAQSCEEAGLGVCVRGRRRQRVLLRPNRLLATLRSACTALLAPFLLPAARVRSQAEDDSFKRFCLNCASSLRCEDLDPRAAHGKRVSSAPGPQAPPLAACPFSATSSRLALPMIQASSAVTARTLAAQVASKAATRRQQTLQVATCDVPFAQHRFVAIVMTSTSRHASYTCEGIASCCGGEPPLICTQDSQPALLAGVAPTSPA